MCVQGPQVMSGYWNDGVATGEVMTRDGYLRTGDVAVMDEGGYFRIVDRKKDMISVSGLKAYPNEIENVVMMHPAVLEAACIGVPDPGTREAIKVFVVLRPGMTATSRTYALCASTILRPTRCRGTSSSGPRCPSPTSARSCAAHCGTRYERGARSAVARRRGRVLARGRAKAVVREGRRFRRRHPPALPQAARSR